MFMHPTKKDALSRLSRKKTFNLDDARRAGISHPTLLRMVRSGVVSRLERGIYAVAGKEPLGDEGDYAVVKKRFGPTAVISGLSALSHYNLIDEVPTQIWILVPPGTRTTSGKYRLIRTKRDLKTGVIKEADYKIASPERALIDALVYSSKIGERVVKTAILRALKNKITTEERIFKMGRKLDALRLLDSEWQSILAGLAQ